MSHSPIGSEDQGDRYLYSWLALSEFLAAGGSLSGREANCCFLNTRDSAFADMSAVSGLNFIDDARALAICDWDFDGALDLWITNRTGPRIRFMHNNLSDPQPGFVSFRLKGTMSNRDAIGARLALELEDRTLYRTLRAGEGFLAQSSKWTHFGFPRELGVKAMVVTWPNGNAQRFEGIDVGGHYDLVEGAAEVKRWTPPRAALSSLEAAPESSPAKGLRRTILAGPFQLPKLAYRATDGQRRHIPTDRGVLVNLWSATCNPCLAELTELNGDLDRLAEQNVDVLALNVDEDRDHKETRELLERMWSGSAGFADAKLAQAFDVIQRVVFGQRRPLPLPSSFLIDDGGRLVAIYQGKVSADQVLEDWDQRSSDESWQVAGVPFGGRWLRRPPAAAATATELTFEFMNAGFTEYAQSTLEQMQGQTGANRRVLAVAHLNMGVQLERADELDEAVREFRAAVQLDPTSANAHLALARLLKRQGVRDESLRHFSQAAKADASLADAHMELCLAFAGGGMAERAIAHGEAALAARPNWIAPMNVVARILALHPDGQIRDTDRALQLAEKAIEISQRKDAQSLATLAVVQNATGNRAQALITADEAVRLAESLKNQSQLAKTKAVRDRIRAAAKQAGNP